MGGRNWQRGFFNSVYDVVQKSNFCKWTFLLHWVGGWIHACKGYGVGGKNIKKCWYFLCHSTWFLLTSVSSLTWKRDAVPASAEPGGTCFCQVLRMMSMLVRQLILWLCFHSPCHSFPYLIQCYRYVCIYFSVAICDNSFIDLNISLYSQYPSLLPLFGIGILGT